MSVNLTLCTCNLASLFVSGHIDLQVPSLLKSHVLLGHALAFSTQVLLHHANEAERYIIQW